MNDLPAGWVKTTLGEVVETNISSIDKNYKYSDIYYLDTGSITQGKIDSLQLLALKEAPSRAKRLVKDNSIVYSTVRPVQRHYGIIRSPLKNLVVSTGFTVIDSIKNKANNNFIYYFLTANEIVKELDMIANGTVSTYPSIKPIDIEKLSINLPTLPEQKSIAEILSSFDEKIELLREQNEILETIAQTIFKEWFVNFNYPDASGEMVDSELGDIPRGWQVGNFLDIFELTGGGTPKTSVKKYWKGGIPWYSVIDVPKRSNCFVINTEKNISVTGLNNSSTKLLRKGTTIVSARGTVGKLAIVGREMAMNQSCYGVNGKEGFGDYYVFFQMKEMMNHIKKNVHGAVFDTITKMTFKYITITIASNTKVDEFENIAIPIMDKVLNNVYQIKTLLKIRDSLLPKLMNGEVRVKGFNQ